MFLHRRLRFYALNAADFWSTTKLSPEFLEGNNCLGLSTIDLELESSDITMGLSLWKLLTPANRLLELQSLWFNNCLFKGLHNLPTSWISNHLRSKGISGMSEILRCANVWVLLNPLFTSKAVYSDKLESIWDRKSPVETIQWDLDMFNV